MGGKLNRTEFDFTTDEEFDALQPLEQMVEICGYVESIDGVKHLTNSQTRKSHDISKFVLSNGSQKVRIVMWQEKAVEYSSQIKINQVIQINRGTMKIANTKLTNPLENVHQLECNVQPKSVVKILGGYTRPICEIEKEIYTDVPLSDVMFTSCGKIAVKGFIKCEFDVIDGGKSPFGMGVITDGKYKLCVYVSKYEHDERFSVRGQ